jgi:hypothetical protein
MNDPVLIDECLSPELVDTAYTLGCEAHHAVRYGLSGKPDHVVYAEVSGVAFCLSPTIGTISWNS